MNGRGATGQLSTKGQLTGPTGRLQFDGRRYGVTAGRWSRQRSELRAHLRRICPDRRTSPCHGQTLRARSTTSLCSAGRLRKDPAQITYDSDRLGFELRLAQAGGLNGSASGDLVVHASDRTFDIARLAVVLQGSSWRLSPGMTTHIGWDHDGGVTIDHLTLTDLNTGRQRIDVSGSWRNQGNGALRIQAAGIYLDTLAGTFSQPPRYGGVLDADATIRGVDAGGAPIVNGTFTVTVRPCAAAFVREAGFARGLQGWRIRRSMRGSIRHPASG